MAKGLKYWFEFGTTETPKKVEIYEEGFVGSSTQLTGGSNPLVKSYNKDVGEKYLGGVVSMVINIEAVSTSEFQAINLISENYGDLLIRYLIDGVAQYNAIIVPFEGSDADLSAGIYNVSLGAECGLNQLKNLTYNHSNTRKSIIQVVKECLERLNYFDEFDIKVLDNTKGLIDGDFVGVDYWDTYINDGNFEGLSCLEVINQIKQVYNEIIFSDGAWWIRNIDEISRGNSNILTYDWATLDKTTTTYNRPTVSVQRRAGGTFGRLFSQQNIKITKPKSALSNVFPQGDMDNDTGWTYSGSAGLFLVIEDGFLKNNGATFHTPSASGLDNSYIQSPSIPFYPFQEWFDVREKEKIKIVGKATKGDYIKNLRLQVLAQAAGQTYYLTTEGTWYTFVSGSPTPIIEKTYNEGTDFVIDVPQPPYVTSTILSSADKIQFGEFGYFGNGIIPDTNIQYDLYIRVFYPERLYEEPAMSTDPIYGQELNVDIDYIHVQKVDISGVVENGFSRNYGLAETRDRKIDFTVSIGVGYPSYPSGLDCLFDAATGEDQIVSYKKHSQITGYPIDEHIAYSYLDNLSNQLGFYQGSIEGGLEFTDLIVIDDIKYRIHNLSHDAKFDVSQVKLVELKTFESVIQIDDIVLSDDILRNIEEQITKTLGSSTPLRYVDKNFTEFVLPNGERALGLRDDFKIKTVFSDEVFLRAASDGVITDVAEDTSSDFTLIKPAENGTYATREWVGENGWLIGGNEIAEPKWFGSLTNYDVIFGRYDTDYFRLTTDGIESAVDYISAGNITIEKGNPRLRLRDVGGSVHTSGFDIHVNGDSFFIDDNTHSRNILKNYLSSTTHITEFDADEYYFKDGATTYASLIGGNLNLPSLTASQLVMTDASKNLVSMPMSLTTNYVTKWDGSKFVNSQVFDNGTNIGIGTTSPSAKLHVNTSSLLSGITTGDGLLIGNLSLTSAELILGINGSNGNVIQSRAGGGVGWPLLLNPYGGNVGIGTTSPSVLLEVSGADVQTAQITSTNGDLANLNLKSVGNNTWSLSADTVLRFKKDSTEYMRIASSGNVGIGTTSPSELFHVNGTSRTTNLKITNGATVGYVWQCNNADGSGVWTSPLTSERYIGEWAANSGSAPSGSPTTGDYWVVNTAGTYSGTTYAAGDEIYWNGSTWLKRSNYLTLPTASASILGAVKIGSGLSIDGSGIVSVGTLNQNTTGSAATLTTTRNIAISGDLTWNVNFNGSADVTAVGTLANSGVTAGTYTKITVDAKGRAVSGTTLSASDIPSLDFATKISGKPTTLSGYGITDAWTKTESDGRYVDFTTDNQDITGIKLFSGGLRVSNVLGSTATISRGAYLKDGGATQALYFDATNIGVDYSSFFAVSNAGNIKYLFSDDGLLIGDTLDYEVYASEKLHINGNIRLSGSIKPDNVAPTAGYFLKGVSADNMTWAALSTSDISDLGSYTGFNDTYQAKDATLTALAALDTSGGILTQIGTDTFAKRTISGTTNRISITNGNGVSGNPTIDIASSYVGQASITTLGTITTGIWNAGVIPVLYGGTGSSTQNFVDLSTVQSSIGGAKTFTAGLTAQSITSSSGLVTAGAFSTYGITYNTLGGTMIQSGSQLYFAYKPLVQRASHFVFDRGYVKIGGNTSGLPADIDFATERLEVDGNVRYSGTLKPSNTAGAGFLKSDGTNDSWSTILTSDVYNLETILSGKQDSLSGTGIVRSVGGSISYIDGSNGQIMAKDSAGNYNFMDLNINPHIISYESIAVGDYRNYLSEQSNFKFRDKRYLSISRITDNAKQLNIGMVKASNDAFIGHLGGKLSISATNGLYLNEFESPNAGLRMLTIDASGRISASTITSGGGVISDIQSVLTAGDVATDKTIIFRSTSTAAISLRDGSNVINGTLTNGSQVALSSSTKALEINGDTELNLYSNGNINIGTSSTSQVINLNGMPFNFNEDSLAQGANKWGSSSSSSSPQNGDMILSIFLSGRMIPLKVKAEILNLGSGNKNYLYVDET